MRLAIAGTMAATGLVASPAHADVMEIGPDGVKWVGGERSPAPVAQLRGARTLSGQSIIIPHHEAQRIDPALMVKVRAVGVPGPYVGKVAELCARYELSPALFEALVWQESRWRQASVSPKGARGLAQLMPATARYLGVDPDDPFANLEGGARYLREQLNRFDGNLEMALAAYNSGPGRVERAAGIPHIRETQNYVFSIMGRLANQLRSQNSRTK